jgi:hypothetical protein
VHDPVQRFFLRFISVFHSPFHAAMEIMTSRMLLNLYKAHNQGKNASMSNTLTSPMQFVAPLAVGPVDEEYELDKSII